MPKDNRLYARFVLDFADHPKIAPLSDAAFRCLVEATLWSRKQMTDGFLPRRLAIAKWPLEQLLELSTNDPAKPSLIEREDGWYIHDFAEHQSTRAEIEALMESRKAAGRKGGQARAKQESSNCSSNGEAIAQAKLKPPVSVSVSSSVSLEPSFKKEGTNFFVELRGEKVPISCEVRELVQTSVPTGVFRMRTTREGLLGQAQLLANDGATAEQLRATLAEWCNRPDAYPGHLPHIYGELARKASRPNVSKATQKAMNTHNAAEALIAGMEAAR